MSVAEGSRSSARPSHINSVPGVLTKTIGRGGRSARARLNPSPEQLTIRRIYVNLRVFSWRFFRSGYYFLIMAHNLIPAQPGIHDHYDKQYRVELYAERKFVPVDATKSENTIRCRYE